MQTNYQPSWTTRPAGLVMIGAAKRFIEDRQVDLFGPDNNQMSKIQYLIQPGIE